MKKVHALAGLAVMAPAAAMAAIAPAAAHAAAANRSVNHEAGRAGKTVSLANYGAAASASRWAPIIRTQNHAAPVWTASNKVGIYVSSQRHDSVFVSCYYSGNTGFASDKYWDHVEAERSSPIGFTEVIGHIADHFVNLGGKFPKSAGIRHC